MLADIAQRQRAEQRVTERMQQDITIRMGNEPVPVRNAHTAQGNEIPLAEAVHVVAVADTHKEQRPEKVRA